MNNDIKAKWLEALRSGEYEQGENWLQANGKYCCLGVLCELAVEAGIVDKDPGQSYVTFDREPAILPDRVITWAGLPKSSPVPEVFYHGEVVGLSDLNDGVTIFNPVSGEERTKLDFSQIADIIEEQL